MKYYIVDLKNIEQNLNKLYLEKKEIIYKFLTEDCIIKERAGEFYKFKIQDNNCDVRVENYIKDHTIVGTDFFEKKIEPIYYIPYEHHLINMERRIYSLRQNTKFIVEYIDGKMTDYYFRSNEDPRNFSLKEDIYSFLSILM